MPPLVDSALARHLEALYGQTDGLAQRDNDPVAFVHRYTDPADQEIAALFAAGFAYGRVSLFRPVLAQLFDHLDAFGGPRQYVATFSLPRAAPLRGLIYRWNRGNDVVWLLGALQRLRVHERGLQHVLSEGGSLRERLTRGVEILQDATLAVAREDGFVAATFSDLPRGIRFLLPSPRSGSACKRWNMFLRWMVRPPTEHVDLGLWTSIRPDELLMPVDVHVLRISRLLGLTTRKDGSWKTAQDITAALALIDPHDPVRFDFALAHVGISGGCLGHRDPTVCPSCPLDPVCKA
jgi:uncharacterized protein (TIGR02757 family)